MLKSVSELEYLSSHCSGGIIEADVFAETRAGIPVCEQRRFDVYRDVSLLNE
jgi:hypothetical protein